MADEALSGAELRRRFRAADGDSSETPTAPAPADSAPISGADIRARFNAAEPVPPEVAAAPGAQSGGWGDTVTNALKYGTGVIGSFTHGLSGGLDRPLNALVAGLAPNSGFARMQADIAENQKQFETEHPVVSTLAQAAGTIPTYAAGEGALAGSVLPPIARGGVAGMVGSAATSAARNALVNSAISAGTADGDLNDRIAAARQGAIVGGIAGPVGDAAGAVLGKGIGAVTGGAGGASAADAALGKLALDKYKIPVAASDLTSNPLYRIGGDQLSHLPFSGAAGAAEKKLDAWHTAVSHEMGADSKAFTPDVMKDVRDRTGQVFEDVANRTSIATQPVNKMGVDLADLTTRIDSAPISPADKETLKRNIDTVLSQVDKNGEISGRAYQDMTKKKGIIDALENAADPNTASFGGDIRDALDNAFDASASPADQAALRAARYQWRVMKTVEPLAAKSRDGRITPMGFANQVATASRRFDPGTGGMAYTGGGNIGELSKIGQLMRPAQNTGSGDRAIVNLLATGGAMGGVAALTDPLTSLSVPGGLLLNNLGQRYLNSPSLANRVINSSLNPQATARYAPYVVPMANALASGRVPIQ